MRLEQPLGCGCDFLYGLLRDRLLGVANQMSVYLLDLEREIDRRWRRRLGPKGRAKSADHPTHPNDIRLLPKRPDDRGDLLRKSELVKIDRDKERPSRREQDRHLMER
jgi:hypothetical protein